MPDLYKRVNQLSSRRRRRFLPSRALRLHVAEIRNHVAAQQLDSIHNRRMRHPAYLHQKQQLVDSRLRIFLDAADAIVGVAADYRAALRRGLDVESAGRDRRRGQRLRLVLFPAAARNERVSDIRVVLVGLGGLRDVELLAELPEETHVRFGNLVCFLSGLRAARHRRCRNLIVDERARRLGARIGGVPINLELRLEHPRSEESEGQESQSELARPLEARGCVAACHRGGCGFWSGLGRTDRSGIFRYFPSKLTLSFIHIFGMARTASSHWPIVSSGSIANPPSSCSVIEPPVPSSTSPFDRMSSTAARSATRTGWL